MTDFISELIKKPFVQNFLNERKEREHLKKILYANPLLIYKSEEEWKNNLQKISSLSIYNQSRFAMESLLGYMGAIHLIGMLNLRVSKQYALRRAWANYVIRKSWWICLTFAFGGRFVLDQQQDFSNELEKMHALNKNDSYLYHSGYIKEKYFAKLNNKLSALFDESAISQTSNINTKKEQSIQRDQQNNPQSTTATTKDSPIRNDKTLKSDDYYFEIQDVIEDLNEEEYFD